MCSGCTAIAWPSVCCQQRCDGGLLAWYSPGCGGLKLHIVCIVKTCLRNTAWHSHTCVLHKYDYGMRVLEHSVFGPHQLLTAVRVGASCMLHWDRLHELQQRKGSDCDTYMYSTDVHDPDIACTYVLLAQVGPALCVVCAKGLFIGIHAWDAGQPSSMSLRSPIYIHLMPNVSCQEFCKVLGRVALCGAVRLLCESI